MKEEMEKEITIIEMIQGVGSAFKYLLSKWVVILLVVFSFGVLGILYAWLQKPVYTAEMTFAPETGKGSSLGMYAGIAAQFGIDMGGGGGGVFEGDNLIEFLKSKMLVEKTLFSKVAINGKNETLIQHYANYNKLYEDWHKKPALSNIDFTKEQPGVRSRDSLIKMVVKNIRNALVVEKVDKKLSIISARLKSEDEAFAKSFIEQLTLNGIQYYIDYRSKKSKENVEILQRQTDSVKALLSGSIYAVAASTDLNVNPTRQVGRTNTQHRQVDVQVNSKLYEELLKQLELSKIALRKETPLIQIIDTPGFPLEKKKLGRLKGGIIFAFVGGLVCCLFLLARRQIRKWGVSPDSITFVRSQTVRSKQMI